MINYWAHTENKENKPYLLREPLRGVGHRGALATVVESKAVRDFIRQQIEAINQLYRQEQS